MHFNFPLNSVFSIKKKNLGSVLDDLISVGVMHY